MPAEVRCLITNRILQPGEWFWFSWEVDAALSAQGISEIEIRRHDPDDEFAKLLWEEWEWSREIGYPDL
jgi:hypothetical protein